jgi:hypothetical protein
MFFHFVVIKTARSIDSSVSIRLSQPQNVVPLGHPVCVTPFLYAIAAESAIDPRTHVSVPDGGSQYRSRHQPSTHTVFRDWFRDRATYFDVRGFENRVLTRHGGTESRTTVSDVIQLRHALPERLCHGPNPLRWSRDVSRSHVQVDTCSDAINDDDVYDVLQNLDRYRDFLFAV